ncbi:MAG: hypothetical protein K9J30_00765 [Bacteroidales bacterium]|nr:hypothetical protein [Bacteroidales bacterium]
MKRIILLGIVILLGISAGAQPVPNKEENIPHLMTFGKEAGISWGDDDFSQAFFFLIPKDFTQQIFIRVFDPDTGGEIDEIRGFWNTQCSYEVFGGEGCHSEVDARETRPFGNYKSGTLLSMKVFGENPRYDNNWYTFGPYSPEEGEFEPMFDGYIFKIICEGIAGDDGNMYNYYLSTSANENIPIEGSNAFAYEYSFRMHNDPNEVSHIYPYITEGTITVQIQNFDWDFDGEILIVSRERDGARVPVSGDADDDGGEENWVTAEMKVEEGEINSSYDLQFAKSRNPLVRNNNVVINIRNQYDETMPFYTSPIGGVPKYKYSVIAEPIDP